MKDKQPTYLLEFPNEDYRKCLKLASAIECKSMKDFILSTLNDRVQEILNANNITNLDNFLNNQNQLIKNMVNKR